MGAWRMVVETGGQAWQARGYQVVHAGTQEARAGCGGLGNCLQTRKRYAG